MYRILALAVGLLACLALASPAGAQQSLLKCGENDLSVADVIVSRGEEGQVFELNKVSVPADLQGETVDVVLSSRNNKSVHPGTSLIVSSGNTQVVVEGVEDVPNSTKSASGALTLGSDVKLSVKLGPDKVSSAGGDVKLTVDCPPPSQPPAVTPPAPPVVTPPVVTPPEVTPPPEKKFKKCKPRKLNVKLRIKIMNLDGPGDVRPARASKAKKAKCRFPKAKKVKKALKVVHPKLVGPDPDQIFPICVKQTRLKKLIVVKKLRFFVDGEFQKAVKVKNRRGCWKVRAGDFARRRTGLFGPKEVWIVPVGKEKPFDKKVPV